MSDFLSKNAGIIIAWCGAFCTIAIYSVLYGENRLYRFMEHLFIGLAAGFGVYMTWSQVLQPKWWLPMVTEGKWEWIFATVAGSMFYFVYSKRHFWISRIIFGIFMGLASGGIFREFYEIYFPQLLASMRPIAGSVTTVANTLLFYVILLSCMSYFFFSFAHKNRFVRNTSSLGRWLLMIGFGSIFGATIMGRLTLFIGRFNFLVSDWYPAATKTWSSGPGRITIFVGLAISAAVTYMLIRNSRKTGQDSGS